MDYDRIIGLLDKYWKCDPPYPEARRTALFYISIAGKCRKRIGRI